jgi:hypothetical protein
MKKERGQVRSPSTAISPQHIKTHAMTENDLEKLQEEERVTRLEQFLFKIRQKMIKELK